MILSHPILFPTTFLRVVLSFSFLSCNACANSTTISFPRHPYPKVHPEPPANILYIEGMGIEIYPPEPQNYTFEQFQAKLDAFQTCLKAFIHDTVFEEAEFRLSWKILAQKLAHLREQSQWVSPWGFDVLAQLEYAETMLRTMLDSAFFMDYFTPDGGMAQRLVYKAVQLHVGLLRFYDPYGQPDPGVQGYCDNIARYFKLLNSWNEVFNGLDNQPSELIVAFSTHINQIEDALVVLQEKAECARATPIEEGPEGMDK